MSGQANAALQSRTMHGNRRGTDNPNVDRRHVEGTRCVLPPLSAAQNLLRASHMACFGACVSSSEISDWPPGVG